MSQESTSPKLKWILVAVIGASLCVVGAIVLFMVYPPSEYRAAADLQARGFKIRYGWQDKKDKQYPIAVIGENLSVTKDDCRLICQLPRLLDLGFQRCDLSGLNLDNIGNCRELRSFCCDDVTPFPVDEIRKLTVCPVNGFWFTNTRLNDSDLENLVKWTTVGHLDLRDNTGITDAGFEHLEKIASLRRLDIRGTRITKEGIEEFQRKRSDVDVAF